MSDDDVKSHERLRAGYVGAVDHYTSPQRRDAVKRLWEEPELIRVLNMALAQAATPTTVVDVGCGTGVALELLRATDTYQRDTTRALHYVGLDLDEALLSVASDTHQPQRPNEQVSFLVGDVRRGLPVTPVDLVVSSGVPFSHLTRDELTDTLTDMFTTCRQTATPLVAVIDVLGRYSLEWTRMWEQERWSYRMSFFATDRDADATDMTTYDAATLTACLHTAAATAGVTVTNQTMVDRSLMVGRHTMTGEYTPNLPSWRTLINALHDGATPVALEQLRCTLQLPQAPAAVTSFFASFIPAWNDTIDRAIHTQAGSDETTLLTKHQPELFSALRALELSAQPGLGVGHSLTAVVTVKPDA